MQPRISVSQGRLCVQQTCQHIVPICHIANMRDARYVFSNARLTTMRASSQCDYDIKLGDPRVSIGGNI